jgi:hypothetical protein
MNHLGLARTAANRFGLMHAFDVARLTSMTGTTASTGSVLGKFRRVGLQRKERPPLDAHTLERLITVVGLVASLSALFSPACIGLTFALPESFLVLWAAAAFALAPLGFHVDAWLKPLFWRT